MNVLEIKYPEFERCIYMWHSQAQHKKISLNSVLYLSKTFKNVVYFV